MTDFGLIKLYANGRQSQTRISVTAPDGTDIPILVEGVAFDLRSDDHGRQDAWIRLDCCFGNSVKLEVPMDGSAIAKVTELLGEEVVHRKANQYNALRREVERVIELMENDPGATYEHAAMLRAALS